MYYEPTQRVSINRVCEITSNNSSLLKKHRFAPPNIVCIDDNSLSNTIVGGDCGELILYVKIINSNEGIHDW